MTSNTGDIVATKRVPASATTLGIDIGGANLKYATGDGDARSLPFPLWMRPEDLAAQLQHDIAAFSDVRRLAVTMTGELADCFLDRDEGVKHIVHACAAAADRMGCREAWYYGVDGRFHDASSACRHPDRIAAANWHALGSHVAQRFANELDEGAVLIDVGSTTTDMVPLRHGRVTTTAKTDFDRLREGSLVYVGGERTTICSLVDKLTFRGQTIPVMREAFATMDDARLLTGHAAENLDDTNTSDGKPRDLFHAANRMARMIGLDHRSVSIDEAVFLARQVHERGRAVIAEAFERCKRQGLIDGTETWIVSGHANDLLPSGSHGVARIQLASVMGQQIARCAPAFAAACLLAGVNR